MRFARFLVIGTATTLAIGLGAAPAAAAPTDDTVVTFTIEAGTLDILAAATADDIATGDPGAELTGLLGDVTTTDSRASADASWLATTTSTDFTTGGATATETILATEVDYWSGPATATTGTGTFTPGQLTLAAAAPLDTVAALTSFTHAGGTGNNTATWAPTLVINAPLDSQAGEYTGTVTHSVA